MKVWIDVETGTWGNAEDIRIVDVASEGVDGLLEILQDTDDATIAIGLAFGKSVA